MVLAHIQWISPSANEFPLGYSMDLAMDLAFSQAAKAFARAGWGRRARGDPARANASTSWEKDKSIAKSIEYPGGNSLAEGKVHWIWARTIEIKGFD